MAEHGQALIMGVDASEKIYRRLQLTVTNPGGHSSIPVPDNAIYHLADGLGRLERYQFPFELNDVNPRLLPAIVGRSKPDSGPKTCS